MTDNVSKIKERLDIVEVVGSYVKLQKAGTNYRGRCPFHNEKTPSFFVSPDRQIWHCFGCAKGGDMFEFVKEIEGVEFSESLKILAARAGIELETFRPANPYIKDQKTRLYEVCELATKFFQKQFESSTGKKALQYLKDRGLTPETIRDFRLGFAPNDWEGLSGYLEKCGYTETEIVDAGMAVRRADDNRRGGVYDRFRSRIMFPISDIAGQVVGFSGRVFEVPVQPGAAAAPGPIDQAGAVMAKYVNTPQTLIYDKSRVLYGLSQAKLDIKKADQCILVEGNIDALMSYQGGVRNVVASSGTALSPHHLRLLQRYTKNLGFCFDSDQAGAAATKRGIGLALAGQFNIRVVEINDKECKDPADYVKKYGPKWSAIVASSKPVVDYYFDKARASYNPTSAESKKTVLAMVAPFVKRLASSVERSHWTAQLASLLRVPEPAVAADIAAMKDELAMYETETATASAAQPPKATAEPAPIADPLNETILSVALKNPAVLKTPGLEIPYDLLEPATADTLRAISKREGPFTFASFVANFSGEAAMRLEFANLRAQEVWNGFSDEDLALEFGKLLGSLRRRTLSIRLAGLQFDLKEAERLGDRDRIARLISEFDRIAQELKPLTHYAEEKNQTAAEKIPAEAEVQKTGEEKAGQETGLRS